MRVHDRGSPCHWEHGRPDLFDDIRNLLPYDDTLHCGVHLINGGVAIVVISSLPLIS